MACAPPRVGSDAALQLALAQGDQLSKHCKMRQSLFRSSLWHKSCTGQPHLLNVRNMASQAVAIEEMEGSEFSEKKTMRWQRWQAHETTVLIAAKKQHELGQAESTEAAGIEKKKVRDKWKEIEVFCQEKGIERSAEQCQTRWSRLTSAYTQIRSWEENKTPEQLSFWSMKLDERKNNGFLLFLDQKTYDALDEIHNKKADDIKNALVEDDGEAYKGDDKGNQPPGGFKNDEKVQSACKPNCEKGSEMHLRDADAKFSSEEIEGCKSEKRGDPCKEMESTEIFSTYLHDDQVEVDDSIKAQLQHASAEKMNCNHKELHKSQHAGSLKVLGTAEHTNPMFYCDEKEVNNYNIAQLLHASKEMDGSNKDPCKGYLEGHGIEEHINFMPRDDNNSQFSPKTHDGTMPAAREGMEEQSEGVDGSSLAYHETHADSLKAGGLVHANDFSASIEKHECQETVIGVDVLDENLIGHTAGSCKSMDEQGCKNLFEERNRAKEACIDNEKGEGFFEVCKDNSPPCNRNAEDISNAWVSKTQSNYMEAQRNNDVSKKVEDIVAEINNFVPIVGEAYNRDLHSSPEQQQLDSNSVTDSKEGTGTDGVFEHGREDDNTFPCIYSSEISERTSSIGKTSGDVQDGHFQKNQSQPSREDHVITNAGIEEGIASAFEHSTGHSFKEKRGGELQNGTADYNGKTTKHSQNIEHLEVAVNYENSLVKTELCGQSQLVDGMEKGDATDRMKVAIKEGVYLTEMMETRSSTVDAGTSALSSPQHQFHHASSTLEHKGLFKGEDGSSGKVCEISESASSIGKTSDDVQDGHFQKNQSQLSREDHVKTNAGIEEEIASAFEHSTNHSFKEKRGGGSQNGSADYNGKPTKHSQNIEHFDVAVKDGGCLVKTELCGQSQLVNGTEGSDATDRVKVAIKEGVYLTEIVETRSSIVDASTSALSSLQHQFHHASSTLEHKSLIKGEDGSSGKDCEVKRAESSETTEFVSKDGRGSPMTSGKGTVEDQSQKSNNSSKFDEDVFMYIPAAIGSLVRSVLQTIRNFLKL